MEGEWGQGLPLNVILHVTISLRNSICFLNCLFQNWTWQFTNSCPKYGDNDSSVFSCVYISTEVALLATTLCWEVGFSQLLGWTWSHLQPLSNSNVCWQGHFNDLSSSPDICVIADVSIKILKDIKSFLSGHRYNWSLLDLCRNTLPC